MPIVSRIGSAFAALCLAGVAGLTIASPAQAASGSNPRGCTFEATLDFAPNLSLSTSTKHVIGSGRLTHCADLNGTPNLGGDFRIVGDGPANCMGQRFTLYQEIYWNDGGYSIIELTAPSLLGIGIHSGVVLDHAFAGSHVDVVSVPNPGFLLQCLSLGGVHRVSFAGTEFFVID
ncbi:MAG TPA: hypothetical protein DGT23_21230 [Micromonosporaceae bacterium]|nr:hypothetical protein [Micromonosporaceae bacterium]